MENAVDNKYCFKISIDSHTNMLGNYLFWSEESWCHFIPNADFDYQNEGHEYRYWPVNSFEYDPWDCILPGLMGDLSFGRIPWLWTDWLDYD